jgi:alpha,alpha-trehalase
MNNYSFDAVIFDLDGVITKTAVIHTQAWKSIFDEYLRLRENRNHEPFQEFSEKDYLTYVDGKPRYKGVKSFLESRKIFIPFGEPSDSPTKETICGIGNKKNKKFLELLREKKVEVYSSTIQLIKELRKKCIKIGVVSSSKNCKYVLESAKIEELFDTRVDGVVASQLGLKGKPEADIFVTASYNLKTSPAHSIVVEDAVSGVQAGRNGGFGLVIGVARKNNSSQLLTNGADIAIHDLEELNLEIIEEWFSKKTLFFFKFWDKEPKIEDLFKGEKIKKSNVILNLHYLCNVKSIFTSKKKPVFFLDYDGTLTPIVERPEDAILSKKMREIIKNLSEKYTVAIISGRKQEEIKQLVKIENIFYAGCHGFDISGSEISMIKPNFKEKIPLISKIKEKLNKEFSSILGILIEDKKFSVAVHYRLVDEKYLPQIENLVTSIIKNNPSLRLMRGKKVFEILPIDWDKGKAIRLIMQVLNISWQDSFIIYIGDDTTDEDAFRTIRTRGVGILVSEREKESFADFQLFSHREVENLLELFISFS